MSGGDDERKTDSLRRFFLTDLDSFKTNITHPLPFLRSQPFEPKTQSLFSVLEQIIPTEVLYHG